MSKLEEELALQLKLAKFPTPIREYRIFSKIKKAGLIKKKSRCDFVWPEYMLIVEVEGGIWTNGRHVRGTGFINDCEKYNEATLLGYKVLRVTAEHIKSGQALNWIEEALKTIEN